MTRTALSKIKGATAIATTPGATSAANATTLFVPSPPIALPAITTPKDETEDVNDHDDDQDVDYDLERSSLVPPPVLERFSSSSSSISRRVSVSPTHNINNEDRDDDDDEDAAAAAARSLLKTTTKTSTTISDILNMACAVVASPITNPFETMMIMDQRSTSFVATLSAAAAAAATVVSPDKASRKKSSSSPSTPYVKMPKTLAVNLDGPSWWTSSPTITNMTISERVKGRRTKPQHSVSTPSSLLTSSSTSSLSTSCPPPPAPTMRVSPSPIASKKNKKKMTMTTTTNIINKSEVSNTTAEPTTTAMMTEIQTVRQTDPIFNILVKAAQDDPTIWQMTGRMLVDDVRFQDILQEAYPGIVVLRNVDNDNDNGNDKCNLEEEDRAILLKRFRDTWSRVVRKHITLTSSTLMATKKGKGKEEPAAVAAADAAGDQQDPFDDKEPLPLYEYHVSFNQHDLMDVHTHDYDDDDHDDADDGVISPTHEVATTLDMLSLDDSSNVHVDGAVAAPKDDLFEDELIEFGHVGFSDESHYDNHVGHEMVDCDPTVVPSDPTLLYHNAGLMEDTNKIPTTTKTKAKSSKKLRGSTIKKHKVQAKATIKAKTKTQPELSTIGLRGDGHRIRTSLLSNPALPTIKEGLRLATPGDREVLNKLHCFVRQELLELFVLSGDSDKTAGLEGHCGLRCVYCGTLDIPKGEPIVQTMRSFYPKSVRDMYRAVCTWQRIHFPTCPYIPSTLKAQYAKFKSQDLRRGKKAHWIQTAKNMGLRDVDNHRNGIVYCPELLAFESNNESLDPVESKNDDDEQIGLIGESVVVKKYSDVPGEPSAEVLTYGEIVGRASKRAYRIRCDRDGTELMATTKDTIEYIRFYKEEEARGHPLRTSRPVFNDSSEGVVPSFLDAVSGTAGHHMMSLSEEWFEYPGNVALERICSSYARKFVQEVGAGPDSNTAAQRSTYMRAAFNAFRVTGGNFLRRVKVNDEKSIQRQPVEHARRAIDRLLAKLIKMIASTEGNDDDDDESKESKNSYANRCDGVDAKKRKPVLTVEAQAGRPSKSRRVVEHRDMTELELQDQDAYWGLGEYQKESNHPGNLVLDEMCKVAAVGFKILHGEAHYRNLKVSPSVNSIIAKFHEKGGRFLTRDFTKGKAVYTKKPEGEVERGVTFRFRKALDEAVVGVDPFEEDYEIRMKVAHVQMNDIDPLAELAAAVAAVDADDCIQVEPYLGLDPFDDMTV